MPSSNDLASFKAPVRLVAPFGLPKFTLSKLALANPLTVFTLVLNSIRAKLALLKFLSKALANVLAPLTAEENLTSFHSLQKISP